MRIEIVKIDSNITCVALDGRMDAPGCDRVETSFTAATSAAGGDIVVDLTRIDYIGSLGIRLLISCARVVQRRGRKIVLFGPQEQPSDVFETVAIADLVPIAETRSDALALVANGG